MATAASLALHSSVCRTPLQNRAALGRQRTLFSSIQVDSRACALSFSSAFHDSLPELQCAPVRVPAARAGTLGPLVLAMAEKKPKKKVDSAIKRAKQAEVRRIYNKSRKTEMSTRMKKVFKALEELRRSPSPVVEDLAPIEQLIGEAYRIIDMSVKVGTIHKNKGARRKSRLARAKREVSIALGWYTPAEEPQPELAQA